MPEETGDDEQFGTDAGVRAVKLPVADRVTGVGTGARVDFLGDGDFCVGCELNGERGVEKKGHLQLCVLLGVGEQTGGKMANVQLGVSNPVLSGSDPFVVFGQESVQPEQKRCSGVGNKCNGVHRGLDCGAERSQLEDISAHLPN